jgi:Kef-type K+ transport system membrane component KefB
VQWPTALALLGGLVVTKAAIIAGLSRAFGLSNGDSARTGLLLSGGGAVTCMRT